MTETLTASTAPQATTWTLTPAELAATTTKLAKINARAVKRGFTGTLDLDAVRRQVTSTNEAGIEVTETVFDVTITGAAPSYAGWTFLAAVDTLTGPDGGEFVVRCAPGVDEQRVDRSILVAGQCQHCNTFRTNRIRTFLVANDATGELVQVGSTCLKDFTGWQGNPVFVHADDLESDLFEGGFGAPSPEWSATTVIATAWAAVQAFGWRPSSWGEHTTRDTVDMILGGRGTQADEARREVARFADEANRKAPEILAAVLESLEGDDDGFAANLRAVLRSDAIGYRHLGIAVSAISVYQRLMGQQAKAAAQADKVETAYAGTLGQKLTVTGTVTVCSTVENNFGYHTTYSMLIVIVDGPTVAKMFTAAAWALDVEQGDTITVTGTVKAHEEYQGDKQTVLSRPKLVAVAP